MISNQENVFKQSGKLKAMFSTLLDCGQSLQKHINKMADEDKVIEVRELAARFTTDIIGSIAFGIDANTIENPDVDFRRYGRKVVLLFAYCILMLKFTF